MDNNSTKKRHELIIEDKMKVLEQISKKRSYTEIGIELGKKLQLITQAPVELEKEICSNVASKQSTIFALFENRKI